MTGTMEGWDGDQRWQVELTGQSSTTYPVRSSVVGVERTGVIKARGVGFHMELRRSSAKIRANGPSTSLSPISGRAKHGGMWGWVCHAIAKPMSTSRSDQEQPGHNVTESSAKAVQWAQLLQGLCSKIFWYLR